METQSNPQLACNNTIRSAKNDLISESISIPCIKVYSDRLVLFSNIQSFKRFRNVNENSLKNLTRPTYTGGLSPIQKRKIRQKLTAWLESIEKWNESRSNIYERKEFNPVFITLTLSDEQKHDDKFIRRNMLDLFIKNLKNKTGLKYYFWRAETQQNGNIHYHLIIDKYVKWKEIRDIWNRIQKRYGYLEKFFSEKNNYDANSTDVKGVKNVSNFINYVLKYALKDEKNRTIDGKVYGMSDELRELEVFNDVVDNEMCDLLLKMENSCLTTSYKGEYFTIVFFSKEFYKSIYYEKLQQRMRKYYYDLYENLYKNVKKEVVQVESRASKVLSEPKQLFLFPLSDRLRSVNFYKYFSNI